MLELLLTQVLTKGDLENRVQAMIDIKLEGLVIVNITVTGQLPNRIEFHRCTSYGECKKISVTEVREALEKALEINIHC